jgi:hypothetical protein
MNCMGYNNEIYIFIYLKIIKFSLKYLMDLQLLFMKIILKMAQSKIIEFLFLRVNKVSMIL